MLELLGKQIEDRIKYPAVKDVYLEWEKRGLLEESLSFLGTLPENDAEVVAHSLVAHVHREKSLFMDLVGDNLGIEEDVRKPVAVSSDILWALSLMIDDIEDQDSVRGNLPSCWAKYGKGETIGAAFSTLGSLTRYLADRSQNKHIRSACMHYVALGLRSITEHKYMDLDTPIGVIVSNYENRCDFHATLQIAVFHDLILKGRYPDLRDKTIAGFRCINRAGQLINDLKDIAQGDIYERGFSDIRNGVPTVPLIYLYRNLNTWQTRAFLNMFGKGYVNTEERQLLNSMVSDSKVIERTMARIGDEYEKGLEFLSVVIDDPSLLWFERWVGYKKSSFLVQLSSIDK